MKNTPIRILILLAIATLIGIVSTQIYWLNQAIKQQDQVFNHNVNVALRNVVESLCEANGKDYPSNNPIEQVSGNYFIVRTNDLIDIKNLEYLITAEIRERAIIQDFEYGVYDCQNDEMVFSDNVNLSNEKPQNAMPILENEEYYFGVYFPEKSKDIIGGMDVWKFTTALTIIVVIFFGYGLFVILKQKRLSEVQRDFVNNVTHELKTPLATLTLASTTLSERFSNETGKYAEIIQQETNRLHDQVEKILKSALIEEKTEIEKEEINLEEFLSTILERSKDQYARQMVEWNLVVENNLNIKTDQSLLDISISNLIDNAVKYGGKQIEIKSYSKRNKIIISISDNGQGISSTQVKKVFRKFYRVPEDQNQHNVKGFGLGLHIVKSSINRLKGSIRVESKENVGSTFIIELPNG